MRVECSAVNTMYDQYDQYLHAYEKLSLGTAGVIMGLVLLLLHGFALLNPEATKNALRQAATHTQAAKILLIFKFNSNQAETKGLPHFIA